MENVTLGRTGLQATVMGLGCGGHSRLGVSHGRSEEEASEIVREALDLGINFIDTAEVYGTESIVGKGLAGVPRDQVILSTKAGVGWQDRRSTACELRERVNASLKRLKTDYIDIFHVHGVMIEDYDYALAEWVPALLDLRTEGKIRFIGITEAFAPDPAHKTLTRALHDDCWDVMMVGFNILNQSARDRILPHTRAKNIGTLCMFAVRRALSQPEALRELLQQLIDRNLLKGVDGDDALDFLVAKDVAFSLQDAAYRFCRWEPGIDLVLSGTGSISHLRTNAESLGRPALPPAIVERLRQMFAGIDSITGN
jgi:aryl-alcohol dehydrogenase-like predicted oxidoreductase